MSDKAPLDAAGREAIRQRYLAVDTSNVADVLDALGLPDQGLAPSFGPYPAHVDRLAGWAYTIRGQMTPFPLGGDAEKMKACQGVSPGEVTVWSGDGEGICYFGELIAIGMKERGCVGALVDGGIRDISWIGEQKFPVFARYRTPVQSIGRWKVNACQVPVLMRGATARHVEVKPGDFILADEDGAIVIPADLVEKVLVEAERLTATEVLIRKELSQGLSLAEALAKYGHV
ncbi:RraA family protein [Labrys monachus]|uniref:Putative 4-hydroxy-4-methyl-2-oxoglutarate aldolase n=1 Tax=Labrys monachus TaxID=217067 RepID=A0ABU0F9X3_9HYPH|nr:RraA family protein [Labrys monachus]MDQ0391420.1 regulator of RNase E activity RraA [Labrys monachus]